MCAIAWNRKISRFGFVVLLVALVCMVGLDHAAQAQQLKQKVFNSPEEAVKALMVALKENSDLVLLEIFGPGSEDLVMSGDPVADDRGRDMFRDAYGEANRLVREKEDKVVLHVGKDDWPFPIPIVKEGSGWLFDTDEGMEEVLNRRVGRNELNVIQVCLAYVDAQREYATKDRDKDGVLEYAQKFMSSPGKRDGLFWEAKEGDRLSPLGPLVVQAVSEGYRRGEEGQRVPYHGYYYKILKAQGKNAQGGAYEYVVKGKMMGGFALVAWPAKYGASGIMSFMVNHDGMVYEKDLGVKTASIASGMTKFDPDSSWKKAD